MTLTLTLMNRDIALNKDIQVNSQQKIIDTLHILKEAQILQGLQLEEIKVKSHRRGMYIQNKGTYEEERINTGDILELI